MLNAAMNKRQRKISTLKFLQKAIYTACLFILVLLLLIQVSINCTAIRTYYIKGRFPILPK